MILILFLYDYCVKSYNEKYLWFIVFHVHLCHAAEFLECLVKSSRDGTRVPIYNFLDALARIGSSFLRHDGPIKIVDRA